MVRTKQPQTTNTEGKFEQKWREGLFPVLTYVEVKYRAILNEILLKPNWWEKINDKVIVEKWRNEFRTILCAREKNMEWERSGPKKIHQPFFEEHCEEMFEYLLEELHFIAKKRLMKFNSGDREIVISPTCGHGITYSDSLISSDLLNRFKACAEPLEQAALAKNNWHIGSNEQQLDIIHPSEYCLSFDKTLYSDKPNALFGERKLQPPIEKSDNTDGNDVTNMYRRRNVRTEELSADFQWIPSIFKCGGETGQANFPPPVAIKSYINGLQHRNHPKMYEVIEEIFAHFIPMFETAIKSLTIVPRRRIEASTDSQEFQMSRYEFRAKEFRRVRGLPQDIDLDDSSQFGEEYETYGDENEDEAPVAIPPLGSTCEEELDEVFEEILPLSSFSGNLLGRELQVIVKISSTRVSEDDDKTSFAGGQWHIEGMKNECIAATGLLYYCTEDIGESRLLFRHRFKADYDEFQYEQNESSGIETVYNMPNNSEPLQNHCVVKVREGMALVFPNSLQHRVAPYSLAGKDGNSDHSDNSEDDQSDSENKKVPFSFPPYSGFGFGAPNVGGFGAPNVGGFGAPAVGGFGAPNVGGFGAPAVGGFGAPAVGGFGAPNVGAGSGRFGGFGFGTPGFVPPTVGGLSEFKSPPQQQNTDQISENHSESDSHKKKKKAKVESQGNGRVGYRKTLCFFLVHPDHSIPSTRNIPPQRPEWIVEELFMALRGRLPRRVCLLIVEYSGSAWSEEEVANVCKKFIKERSNKQQGGFADVETISFCEH